MNYTHDRLLQEMYTWIHNNQPHLRGLYFHVPNECKPYPGESKHSHVVRLSKLKAIGTLPGVLDHLLILKGKLYGFDAKVGSDKLGPDQVAFIERLRINGGDGFEIRDMEQFRGIINSII